MKHTQDQLGAGWPSPYDAVSSFFFFFFEQLLLPKIINSESTLLSLCPVFFSLSMYIRLWRYNTSTFPLYLVQASLCINMNHSDKSQERFHIVVG